MLGPLCLLALFVLRGGRWSSEEKGGSYSITRSMFGRSRPRDATSVQRRIEGSVERVNDCKVAVRSFCSREPWSLWIITDGFEAEDRVGVGDIVGRSSLRFVGFGSVADSSFGGEVSCFSGLRVLWLLLEF